LSVDANASIVDAEFDEFFSGGISLAGNTPRNVPERNANIWLSYAAFRTVNIGGGLRYVDERYTSDANTAILPSYTVFDAHVSWKPSSRIDVSLRVDNLSDEDDYVLSQYTPNQWIFGDPRSYELTFNYRL
jgi:iron complex outermembrane receptor protein